MKVLVRCTYLVEVELSDEIDDPHFHIEDNGCPGTREVGAALERMIEDHENAGTCWACASQGENKIISIDGKPVS